MHRNHTAGWASFGAATGGSLYAQNLRLRRRLPPTICARLVRPVNALQLATESFHTKKLCNRLSSRKAEFFIRKMEKKFEAPFVHLRLIGKLVGYFLLVII